MERRAFTLRLVAVILLLVPLPALAFGVASGGQGAQIGALVAASASTLGFLLWLKAGEARRRVESLRLNIRGGEGLSSRNP